MEKWEIEFSDDTTERWLVESEQDLDKKLEKFCKNCRIEVKSKRRLNS